MYFCVAIAFAVFEVINVLSTVGVSNVDFVVATPMLVLNRNNLGERGAEDSREDYNGSQVHFEAEMDVVMQARNSVLVCGMCVTPSMSSC